jgi:hypothetical protein
MPSPASGVQGHGAGDEEEADEQDNGRYAFSNAHTALRYAHAVIMHHVRTPDLKFSVHFIESSSEVSGLLFSPY